MYYGKYPETNCAENCVGEILRRINEKTLDHLGRNTNFHLIRQRSKTLDINDFHVTGKGFTSNTFKGEIAESFFIKKWDQLWISMNWFETIQLIGGT